MKRMSYLPLAIILGVTLFSPAVMAGEKPSFEFTPYGLIKLDGSYDQNLTSHGNFVMWVNPPTYDGDDEQFNMTANETRMGLQINSTGYEKVNIRGNIEFDLYASVASGVTETDPVLQLRHAYFAVSSNQVELLAGQTWDLVSPLNPPTLNYSVLWGCGNTGYRRPQIRLTYTTPAGQATNVQLAGGFFRTFGEDLDPTFSLAAGESSDGYDDGTDAAIPSLQGGLDITHDWPTGNSIRLGLSALWGKLKAETNFGNYEEYENWGVWSHCLFATKSGLGISGEFYTGSNLGSYLGGILQESTIDGVKSTGGWASAWVTPTPKLKLNAGFGLDQVDEDDIASGRAKNRCVFGNVMYSYVPNFTVGFELASWKTEYVGDESASSVRAQTSMILNF